MTEIDTQEQQAANRFIRSIRLRNLLSFGPDSEEIELQPLNVLIGPNASGKSNFIDAVSLLKAAPGDLAGAVRQMGGVEDLLWKGTEDTPSAELEATLNSRGNNTPLRYRLSFTAARHRFDLVDELVENEAPIWPNKDAYFFYRFQHGSPVLNVKEEAKNEQGSGSGRVERRLQREDLNPEQSVLSQRIDPDRYPEITSLGDEFKELRFYRDWRLGRYTPTRGSQKLDLPKDFLLEDSSNLTLVLSDLDHHRKTENLINRELRKLIDGVERVTINLDAGGSQLFLHEWGGRIIPATRLSDGTLRYLCLLVILCHLKAPLLTCIEEPELGLHPDVIGTVADLLVEASKRTQLIVTTHSEILVSALSETPESILVCRQDAGGTTMQRLERDKLKEWLKKYSLGDLWCKGVIGGTR
ncbi:MAG: AAA family ATPase [Candidatus Coatesbacteria bacterium]|nr:AAA family ATPase [Candidatus Coatesbacteria bacterium]